MSWEIASGSVPGRQHVLAGRNNQDASAVWTRGDRAIAVVCDGCSEGARSEVGATLGARIVLDAIGREVLGAPDDDAAFERARLAALAAVQEIATAAGGSPSEAIGELFLFTVVGAVVGETRGAVFSIGDGIVVLDGEPIRLGPFPENRPPYLAYGLLTTDARAPRFQIHRRFDARAVRSILLGTDGALDLERASSRRLPGRDETVGPLARFCEDDRFFRNRDAIRRRLALANRDATRDGRREAGLLADDTTVVALRRAAIGGVA